MNSMAPEINLTDARPQTPDAGNPPSAVCPPASEFFTLRDIARATSTYKKAIQRTAVAEQWPCKQVGNLLQFAPPAHIASIIIASPGFKRPTTPPPVVTFAHIANDKVQAETTLLREQAVKLLNRNVSLLGKEVALSQVTQQFEQTHPLFRISVRSLRRWQQAYAEFGLDGLVEQKRGVVGAKPFAADLDQDQLLQLRADSVEHGIKGRLNTARAFRNLVANPTLEGAARAWAHGAHASKSYVPPSVREAARVPALATRLIQIGPKAAKLDGPYTECSYDNLKAGEAFTADDMTCNVYVWCEWPNEDGFLLIRPQLLAVMDIRSRAWLNFRVVMRPKGQYNKDDVWGTIGDTFDAHGLFKIAVLEGGTWQSEVIIGQRTGLDDERRFGGLRSLGVQVIHTRSPRGKIIEQGFNSLQHAMDNVKGFCGRMEMKDCPEAVRQHLALVRAGHAHPRQHFLHVNELSNHIAGVMQALNNERSDGKLNRGEAPSDLWVDAAPRQQMPDDYKWLYRSAYCIQQVTRNGVTVKVGSGKYQSSYTYTNPALEQHRGRRVVCFWNQHDPDTDAVIYTLRNGQQDKLICVASRLQAVDRFGATDDQLKAEATRKKLSQQMAVAESRQLAPYLQRQTAPVGARVPASHSDINEQINRAKAAAEAKTAARARSQAEVRNAGRAVTPADMQSALGGESVPASREQFSADEIANLFQSET
jgi:hypothetical protein